MIKAAHLAEFGPHRCGLYGTAKDMVMAERLVGIDAAFVDAKIVNGKVTNRPNKKDGELIIRDLKWAKTVDILVHHSIVHPELLNLGIPLVQVCHGRPESTFLLEHRRLAMILGIQLMHGKDERYRAFITLWKQYLFHLAMMVPKEKLFYVPAPVDLNEFRPIGTRHGFPGKPKLLIADMWRQDVTPFNTIMAAARFKDKYCPTAKVSLIGTAPKKSSVKNLVKMLKDKDVLGQMHPLIVNTDKCYRGADIVITSHNMATRVVREALACGTPIVAGIGNPYTKFTAESRDPDLFAAEIDRCWRYIQKNGADVAQAEARLTAEKNFHFRFAGEAAKKIFEKVLDDEKTRWQPQGNMQRKRYSNYSHYLKEQKSKLDGGIKFDLKEYDSQYREILRSRLMKLPFIKKGMNVLCLGARQGTEVKAFLDVGCFALGVDLNPGKDNKYVVIGDFHELQYPDDSVDIAFTNSMDHVYRPQKFLKEITRILKPGGHFIIELEKSGQTGVDKWACLHWEKNDDLIKLFGDFNFSLMIRNEAKETRKDLWFRGEQLIFLSPNNGELTNKFAKEDRKKCLNLEEGVCP